MDYGSLASPPRSPETTQLPFNGEQVGSPSDLSSPTSPNGMMAHAIFTNTGSECDAFPFGSHTTPFYDPMAGKIPVEYIGSTTLDEHDRRRSKPKHSKGNENVSNMHLVRVDVHIESTSGIASIFIWLTTSPNSKRRRAQNRASQRAFRERKERHLKSLENKLQDLHSKHQNLLQSYHQRTDEVQQLNSRIQQLTTELDILRSAADGTIDEILTPDKFDIVPYPMPASSPQYYFQNEAFKLNSDQAAYSPTYDGL
ncbi:hypothetical protein AJ78_05486 [Emergomyces pasteurianus Ep9510]|uniref:BZIP domain-containing protein n=1 Tax=Emergomyces pasteurianus Ep9510 TaxID=1447872 RepID=A0A1J9PCA6_9EURO|nr:hypothetical protein AJ78_05486 [Emergomyces pasteurianus Ep9510]